ncbi:DUF397 domain-containing protein [Streptomyces sp. NPDC054847]
MSDGKDTSLPALTLGRDAWTAFVARTGGR